MTRSVVSVTREKTVSELGRLFERHDFNSFPVLEDGNLLGIVTKFDFLKTFAFSAAHMLPNYDELMRRTAAEIMTEAVVQVDPEAPLTRVLELMVGLKMRSFPVLGPARQLLGIISREDVIRALREATQSSASK
jgi:CBS domain-containing protein